jgi:hypothetical protein
MIAAFIGGWEIVLILAIVAIPVVAAGVILLILRLVRPKRRTSGKPPPLPTDQPR